MQRFVLWPFSNWRVLLTILYRDVSWNCVIWLGLDPASPEGSYILVGSSWDVDLITESLRCWQQGLMLLSGLRKRFLATLRLQSEKNEKWSKSVLVIRPGPSDRCYRCRKTWLVQGSGTVGRRKRKKSWALRSESRSNDFYFLQPPQKDNKNNKTWWLILLTALIHGFTLLLLSLKYVNGKLE